jgi:hypothetical protein
LCLFPFFASLVFFSKWIAGLTGLFIFLVNLVKYAIYIFLFQGRVAEPIDIWAPLDSSVRYILLWVILYIFLYRLSLFAMVQFLLPVKKWEDRKKAYSRISLFSQGRHGAAIFIKNGKRIARQSELDSKKPGVALIDLSSAIVLAQHDNARSWYLPDEDEIGTIAEKTKLVGFPWKKKKKSISFWDAKGPGVVFIENGQKIDSIINLRKQTRTSQEVVVYTRNGIKVKSKVTVVFSLSDDPELLTVGFLGGKKLSDLKVLKTKRSENNLIVEGAYDLDFDDAKEIINSINKAPLMPISSGDFASSPYKFDKYRVLKAALSQARNKSGDAILWHEAPLEVATDIFRATLAEIPYDNLFSGSSTYNLYNFNKNDKIDDKKDENLEALALLSVKDDFLMRVKLRGMVTFQFVEHLGGSPFYKGQDVLLSSLKNYAPVTFMQEKFNFFRDRGIVVKNATFSEIQAVEEEIQKKMTENWMAKMENEIAVSNAEYELEAIRVHNRNRALLQEEMTHLLSGVFQSTPHFDEALALRVLQALETSVSEMSDADMQSTDLYEILRNLHDWILFDESHKDLPNNGFVKPESENN